MVLPESYSYIAVANNKYFQSHAGIKEDNNDQR